MAKKQPKNYKTTIQYGRLIFTVENGADGKNHRMSVPYPFYDRDGKLTKKQTENYCVQHAKDHGWL